MTKKYDDFMTELDGLCEKHGVDIGSGGYVFVYSVPERLPIMLRDYFKDRAHEDITGEKVIDI